MTALIIDTYALVKRLKKAGAGEELAAAIASGFSEAGGDLATKADLKAGLAELEVRLTNRIIAAAGFIILAQTGILGLFRFLSP